MNLKKLGVFSLVFIFSLVSLYTKHPLLSSRFFSCSASNLNLDSTFIFSNSGCYYSQITYLFLTPFISIPAEYFRIVTIIAFSLIVVLNSLIIFLIAKRLKINPLLTVLFYVLIINLPDIPIEQIISLTLLSAGLLLYLLNSKKSIFFSGLLMSASLFRPQGLLLIIGLFLFTFISFSRKGLLINVSNLKKSLIFLSGASVILLTYLFDANYLKSIFIHVILHARAFNYEFNFQFILLIFTLLILIVRKDKSTLSYATITCYLVFLSSAVYARFISFILPLVSVLLVRHLNKKFLILIIITMLYSSLSLIILNAVYFPLKVMMESQLTLLNENEILMTDLLNSEALHLYYNSSQIYHLVDPWVYLNLNNFSNINNADLIKELNNITKTGKVSIVIIGPFLHQSSIRDYYHFFNYSNIVIIPNLDHNCPTCRHITILIFKDESDAKLFSEKIINYWSINSQELCNISPYYHLVISDIMSRIFTMQSCSNNIDFAYDYFYFNELNNIIINIALIIMLSALIVSKYVKIKLK